MNPIRVERYGLSYEWNGSRTINIYRAGQNIDCISFGYDKESVTEEDFFVALQGLWRSYVERPWD
jgi:hypothetical protein